MKSENKETQNKTWMDLIQQGYRKSRPFIAAGLAVALMTVSAFQDIKYKVGVLIALGVVLVYLIIDMYKIVKDKVNDFKLSINDIHDSIKNVRDPLSKAAYSGELGEPEVQVAIKMFKASKESVSQLRYPRSFKHQGAYIDALQTRLSKMIKNKHGKIKAACGEKDWTDDGTKRWFENNYEALKCNISINRIFLEETGWDTKAATDQMQMQANKGINVRFAELKKLNNHPMLNNLPKGFGFVIFDYSDNKPEVVVHNDTMNPNEKSVLFDDPMIVGQFISLFNELSTEAYSKEFPSNNQTDMGIRLEKEILQRSEEMTMHIKHLLDHRFSNLQLNFINWRVKTELEKIRKVLSGEVAIYALDKFTYLGDIFGHILDQLREGDKYQTVSTVEIWNERNIGNQKFIRKTALALKRKAQIERVVFIDKKRLENPGDAEYHVMVKNTIDLFDNLPEKNDPLNTIKFFIDNVEGHFFDLLKHAPVVLITEAGNKNRLGINTHHVTSNEANREPFLNLKFYIENESDEHSEEFDEHFGPIVEKSISIQEMKDLWDKQFPVC